MSDSALVPARSRDKARPPAPALRPDQIPTPIEKAAIILTAIGPDIGGAFLRGLAEPDLMRFAQTLNGLGKVRQEVLDVVIVEFLEALTAGPDVAGGAKAARKLLGAVLDDGEVTRLLEGGQGAPRNVWDRLNDTPVAALSSFLSVEHPQTAAVVLSELRPETAASVLERLERGFAQSIVLRLSRVPSLDPAVASAIHGAIERDFLSVLQRNLSKRRPADLIAGLMNNISSEARDGFLGYLEAQEPGLAQDVQRTMFTFEDIPARLNPRDMPAVLRDIPEETLLLALKLGELQGSATVPFVLENVPRRLSERYVEDLGALPEPGRKEGKSAQIEITKAIQALVREGQIRFVEKDAAAF